MSTVKGQVSPIQVYPMTNFKGEGLEETNNLANAYLLQPEKLGSVLAYAFGYQENNVLNLLTGGIGNTKVISQKEYEWDLHAQNERAIEVGYDSPDASLDMPGYGNTRFKLVLSEKWFDETDVLLANDGQTQVRVMTEPYQDGNGWVYTVQLAGSGEYDEYCNPELLQLGATWSKEWSEVQEYSDKGGGHGFVTPFKLRNQLTTLRKTIKVTRNAAKAVMVIELYSPTGEKTKLWSKMSEWTAMAKWYREIDSMLLYSKYNKNSRGEVALTANDGRPIYRGAGFRQQIAPANKQYYTRLTYKILDDFLLNLSYNANKWGGNHKFVALTGKMGMREFDRAISDHANGNNITVDNSGTFITGKGDSLEFTGYFKSVQFLNNVHLTVKEFPPYDDLVRNRELHPISQRPVESYRFTFLNFGTKNGKANIYKIALTESEMSMWTVAGSTDPTSGVAKSTSTQRASGIDGYDMHFLSECGVVIEDPTSCGELILRVC